MTPERREYFYSLCPALRSTETKPQSDANISQKGEITSCAAKTSTPHRQPRQATRAKRSNGTPYARFSAACNYSYKRDGEAVEGCDWIPFIAYGKLAEIASKHLDAGSHVSVDGKLKPWKSTSGDTTRYGLDVVVTDILFLDPKAPAPEEVAQAAAASEAAPPDSDAPF